MSSVVTSPGPYVGSMMRRAHQWVMGRVYRHVLAAGCDDLSRAQVAIFGYPGPDGLRPSQLADRLQITKQSVNDLLRDMEERAYLVRVPDPSDGRARVIRLTAKGRRAQDAAAEGARSAERAIADLLGSDRFAHLRSALEEVVQRLAAGDPLLLEPRRSAEPTDAHVRQRAIPHTVSSSGR